MSTHLNATQIFGLNKLGDHLLPGYGDLKSFSRLGAARNADRILGHMSDKDLADLKLLLTLLAFFPRFLVGAVVGFLERTQNFPGPLGNALRFMRLGIRGLVLTLYYSEPAIVSQIGYKVTVYTADLRPL